MRNRADLKELQEIHDLQIKNEYGHGKRKFRTCHSEAELGVHNMSSLIPESNPFAVNPPSTEIICPVM